MDPRTSPVKETSKNADTLGEYIGAVADSFACRQTDRLSRLEDRLEWLEKWSTYAIIIALAYAGYLIWKDVRLDLDLRAEHPVIHHPKGIDPADDARTSIFILFAIALGGPVALFLAYLVLGFIYNILHDALIRLIPLARFLVVPALLITALIGLQLQRAQLKNYILDAYDAVERRIASAKYIQQQTREMAEAVRKLHQLERELDLRDDPQQADSDAEQADTQNASAKSQDNKPVPPEEAMRQMEEMMQKLQNMVPAEDGQAVSPPQNASPPSPAVAPNPSAPAGT